PRTKHAKNALTRLLCVSICISIVGGQWSMARGQKPTKPTPSSSPAVRKTETREKLPLSFEANQGQLDPQVKFLSRASGYNLYLTPTEAVMAFGRREPRGTGRGLELLQLPARTQPLGASVLRMKLLGADPDPSIRGLDEVSRRTNYFVGDAAGWRTRVPDYGGVEYRDVYKGVDLVYYGKGRELEYDFRVAPGANPGTIAIEFDGAENTEIDSQGDLVLRLRGMEVTQRKP